MATAMNYVKFVRGTPSAFKNLAVKNSDTLYFISKADEDKGSLYLGEKLISQNIGSLSDLQDIAISELLADGQILAYDGQSSRWVNKAITDAIGVMIGATATQQGSNGLVPAPGIGQQHMFLRGDGTWGAPESSLPLIADAKSINILDDNQTIALKDFGLKYYRYVAGADLASGHYELQEVNGNYPWKADLEPKIVKENGQYVLGWFEPIPVVAEVIKIDNQVNIISSAVANIVDVLNSKADTNSVYTKEETNSLISQEIAKADHLKRKTFASMDEAELFILLEQYPENYIYMIRTDDSILLDNQYDEYLYINGQLELVGSWKTDLSDYVTKEELDTTVVNIESILNTKADKTDIKNIDNSIETLNTKITDLNGKIENLEEFLNSDYFINREEYKTDMDAVKDAVTWGDL